MLTSKVSRKGLTNIPAKVRKALGIEEGDILVWKVDEKRKIILVEVVKEPTKYLKGKYNDPKISYKSVEELADEIVLREL